jgi:hypothetical protein
MGAVPTVLNALFAHLVRSEGYSKQASFGMALGGVLNIILDPIFISGFGLEIAGAAIATMLSNLIATLYFILLISGKRKSTVIALNPKQYTLKERIPREVLLVGLPSCIMNIMGVFSNIVLNKLMASYCNEACRRHRHRQESGYDVLCAIATGMSAGGPSAHWVQLFRQKLQTDDVRCEDNIFVQPDRGAGGYRLPALPVRSLL